MGSPLYAGLLELVADDVTAGGPAAEILAGYARAPGADAVALRLMGGVHRLVLQRRAPELAMFYPSVGGTGDATDPAAAWSALRSVLAGHRGELMSLLDQAPQTNEVGRAAALLGGLHHLLAWRDSPVRLAEIGASAGLNLWADLFRVDRRGGLSVGPAGSPVRLSGAWEGTPPPDAAPLRVVERLGCDTAPLDPRTTEGRLRLTSYVWPDQRDRLGRLRGALALAADRPFPVRRQGAADFLADLRLVPGTTTVLWHSVMWQYLPADEQAEAGRLLDALGESATEDARFAHLSFEPSRPAPGKDSDFLVRLRTWPGDQERVLGHAHPHGLPTTWT
jgi:hypothetical protein